MMKRPGFPKIKTIWNVARRRFYCGGGATYQFGTDVVSVGEIFMNGEKDGLALNRRGATIYTGVETP